MDNTKKEVAEFFYGSFGVRDPIEVLRDCIKNEEWFKGLVLSTAFFEGVGTRLLSASFKGTIERSKIENLRSVEQIIMFLFASGIIDQRTYTKMIEVNNVRNKIVHLKEMAVPTEPKFEPEEVKRILKKAIVCLQELFKKMFELVIEQALGTEKGKS